MAEEHVAGVQLWSGKYWREADARRIIEAWQASGLSLREFSRRHGIHPRRLARWSRRLEQAAAERPQFHPVRLIAARVITPPSEEPGIEIILPHGHRVGVRHGFAAADLHGVLDVLEARIRC
jgi:lambda repressor-like predicted transcriptional regulator